MKLLFVSVAILLVLAFMPGDNRVVLTKDAPLPIGPYSQAIKAGKFLFVSGQIGWKPDGTGDTADIESETRQAMKNIEAIVKAGGMQLKDLAKVTIYCTRISDYPRINKVYGTFFTGDPPARETVEVRALPRGAHVEISAIAGS